MNENQWVWSISDQDEPEGRNRSCSWEPDRRRDRRRRRRRGPRRSRRSRRPVEPVKPVRAWRRRTASSVWGSESPGGLRWKISKPFFGKIGIEMASYEGPSLQWVSEWEWYSKQWSVELLGEKYCICSVCQSCSLQARNGVIDSLSFCLSVFYGIFIKG